MSSEHKEPLISLDTKDKVQQHGEELRQSGFYSRQKLDDLGQMTKEKAGEYIQGAHEVGGRVSEMAGGMSEEARKRAGEAYQRAMERGDELAGDSKGIFGGAAESLHHAREYITGSIKSTGQSILNKGRAGIEKIEHIGEVIKQKVVGPSEHKISETKVTEEQPKQTRA